MEVIQLLQAYENAQTRNLSITTITVTLNLEQLSAGITTWLPGVLLVQAPVRMTLITA